jgi:hydrogenase maturation protease
MLDGRAEISRPGPESVVIDGVSVRTGTRVLLHPRTADTDLLMRAIDGRRAIVESIVQDTDEHIQLTVTIEDDPARSLGKGRGLGHRFFLGPDELEPLPSIGAAAPPYRILVAGIGNVFMGDDGFGVAVAAALSNYDMPEGVDVVDFGIRGMDLAYALVDGYDTAVLIDVAPRGRAPGSLEVIEPVLDEELFVGFEAHRMDPVAVLHFARQFGVLPRRTLIVACEPDRILDPDDDELLDELSPAVADAVPRAAEAVLELVNGAVGGAVDEAVDRAAGPVVNNQGAKR